MENEESTYEDIQNAKNDYELSYSILVTKLEQKILSYDIISRITLFDYIPCF